MPAITRAAIAATLRPLGLATASLAVLIGIGYPATAHADARQDKQFWQYAAPSNMFGGAFNNDPAGLSNAQALAHTVCNDVNDTGDGGRQWLSKVRNDVSPPAPFPSQKTAQYFTCAAILSYCPDVSFVVRGDWPTQASDL